MKFTRALPWILATAVLGALAGGFAARMLAQKPITLQSGTWLPQPRALAHFQLTDFDGRPFGNADLNGHSSLMFFGYTNCPDVCPTTLAVVRETLQRAPVAGLRFFFITLDPERDSNEVLKRYLGAFNSSFVGLSGGPPAVAPLLHSLAAAEAEKRTTPEGGYQVEHSATLYLLDTHGRLVAVYSPPLSAQGLGADLRSIVKAGVL